MVEFVLPALIFFAVAFVQGLAGFGAGLVSMALLPLIWELHTAVAVAAVFNLVIYGSMAWHLRRHIELSEVAPMMAAALLGVPLGIWFLHNLEVTLVTAALGLILVLYSLWSLRARTSFALAPTPALAALTGFAGGTLAGAVNVTGPPVLVYGTLRNWQRDPFRANLQCFFALTGSLSVIGFAATGLITTETLQRNGQFAAALVVGSILGHKLCQRIDQQRFRRGVLLGLFAIGVYYLLRPLFA